MPPRDSVVVPLRLDTAMHLRIKAIVDAERAAGRTANLAAVMRRLLDWGLERAECVDEEKAETTAKKKERKTK